MGRPESTVLDLMGYPRCGAPAEVVDRSVLESADGPVEQAVVLCAGRHRCATSTQPTAGRETGPREVVAVPELTSRDRAILRAVAAGTAELLVSVEPDLFVDGRCCSDQPAARRLAHAGLITPAHPAAVGQRVSARLTAAGQLAVRPGAESTPGRGAAPPAGRLSRRGPRS